MTDKYESDRESQAVDERGMLLAECEAIDREATEEEVQQAMELEANAFSRAAMLNRALKSIRKAARDQHDEGGFIGHAMRDRGIL